MLNVQGDSGRDWIAIVKKEFRHPAIVLWRAVELKNIDPILRKYALKGPILDLGCAEGKIAGIFFKQGNIIGLDNCWDLIKENRKIDTYKALIMADALQMPFKEKVFESVFSNCVIEHIQDLKRTLRESARVIKEDGIFLFTVPSHKFGDFLFFSLIFQRLKLGSLENWYKRTRNKLLNHFHCHDHEYWKEILDQHGFALIEHKYYLPKAAIFYWDFMSVTFFILRFLHLEEPFSKKLNNYFGNRIYRYYNMENDIGGGLLLVAQKKRR
jgi:SAM-dependent methyltransferase